MGWVNLAELSRKNPPAKKEAEQVREYQRRKTKVSLYTDENFPSRGTRLLKTLRARVTTAQDKNLRRHPDENHAAYALKYGHVLLTCDHDYLDEKKFPLIHCPAIVVFDFRSGSVSDIWRSFACLHRMVSFPQFFDKWTKIHANPECWTEYCRFLNGTTSRSRLRLCRGEIQEWVDE
jgi:hypothetical protein